MEGFFNVVEKIGILLRARQMFNENPEMAKLWAKCKAMIEENPANQKKWDSFPPYPKANDEAVTEFCKVVNGQLALY